MTQEYAGGLSTDEAAARLIQYGKNAIEEHHPSVLIRFARRVATPMSLMFIAVGVLSLWTGQTSDAILIGALFLANIGVSVWHEAKADTALRNLEKTLAVETKVRRDGIWIKIPAAELVPGDRIELSIGSFIPADVAFRTTHNVTVNEAAVTGESLPRVKAIGDTGYSGTFLATGVAEAAVTDTGSRTYFGKTITLVERVRKQSQLEHDILSISRFLSIVSVVAIAILTIILIVSHQSFAGVAELDASMLIAGIPVAMSTVMTLIISAGVTQLAGRSAIVRRLSSLEDLANVDLLLSDKTGTLTENRIVVTKLIPLAADVPEPELWRLALLAAPEAQGNTIDEAIHAAAKDRGITRDDNDDYIPGDSDRKRTTAFDRTPHGRVAVTLGASTTVRELSRFEHGTDAYDKLIREGADEGFRVLALARSDTDQEEKMQPLAIFYLTDAIRPDAKDTIDFMNSYGIEVKMVTGDGTDVAAHVARELGLAGRIIPRRELEADHTAVEHAFASVAGFAEMLPKDKFDLVTMAQQEHPPRLVAVTGDGVNDVPPVKAANVGIAVANAVDALKGAADIVLTQAGIAVIKDAIIEARKIFMRLYNYSVYRISESFRLIITIAVIGVLFHTFLLTPVQIILIALLNDVPIVTLAFDRVAVPRSPASISSKRRFATSLLYGTVGMVNSLTLLWIALTVFHAPWEVIQTLFFLKLTVSGHMLIYVAHTERPWYQFLPSRQVIIATTITQALATAIALLGIFVVRISWQYAIFVWVWSFFWMQITEIAKQFRHRHEHPFKTDTKILGV